MTGLVKTPAEIEAMRKGGRILAEVLGYLSGELRPGMTTQKIDSLARQQLEQRGGEAAFLGHEGFPATICVSINDQVVHGIPGGRVIKEGDLVGLDFGVKLDAMIVDGAVTVPVGEVSAEARKLLSSTEDALSLAIAQVRAGAKVGDISAVIEQSLAASGLRPVERLSGHGVGRELHEDPEVANVGQAGTGPKLVAGMTIAIEPMACLGSGKMEIDADGWTVVTADHSLAAQFEHTVLVTESGSEILTKRV